MALINVSKCCNAPFSIYWEEHNLGLCSKCNEYVEKADKKVRVNVSIKKNLQKEDTETNQELKSLFSFDDQ